MNDLLSCLASLRAFLAGAMLAIAATGCFMGDPPPGYSYSHANQAPDEEPSADDGWDVFPDSERIDEIIAQPLPEDDEIFVVVGVEVDLWEIDEPAPSRAGVIPYDGDNWGGGALAEYARRRGEPSRVSDGMTCVAREVSRFGAAHDGEMPSEVVFQFMLARCGTTVSPAHATVQAWRVEPTKRRRSPDALRAELADVLAREYRRRANESKSEFVLGAWYDGDEKSGELYLAHGTRPLRLDAFDMNLAGHEHVTISGVRPSWAVDVAAMSTVGARAASCKKVRPVVPGPGHFALRCPVRAKDAAATIDVMAYKENRLLGSRVLTLYVSPDGTMPRVYSEAESPSSVAMSASEANDPELLVELINVLREQHRLSPLILDAGQGEEMAQLLPHFVAASHDSARAELYDTIAMAFLAGRKTESVIKDADFIHFTSEMSEESDVGKVLAQESRSPMVRSLLLNPDASSVAVGMHRSASGKAAAFVVATYTHVDTDVYGALENELFERFDTARTSRRRARPRRLSDAKTAAVMDRAMARMEVGIQPQYAIEQATKQISRNYRRGFGYALLPLMGNDDLELEWPDELLELETISVTLRVGYFRPKMVGWGFEIALVVFTNA